MIRKLLSDVFRAYKLHPEFIGLDIEYVNQRGVLGCMLLHIASRKGNHEHMAILLDNGAAIDARGDLYNTCLLYTSPSPRDRQKSRMPSSA